MAPPIRYTPACAREVEQIVAEAAADSRALAICGGGSKRQMWQRDPAAALDMSAVAGIVDYDPDELVVTALAGTALAELEAALAQRQQMLAFEPFDHAPLFGETAGRATLGGVVAGNVCGPRRISAGAARDHILGFSAVSGRGETFKGGGAVVKNVTGFDLPKLMAGSWGTLAVLTSLTMRVLPRPRTEKTLLFQGLDYEAANGAMTRAMASRVAVSAAAHLACEGITSLRLEGFGPSVDARCRELSRELQDVGSAEVLEGEGSQAFWRRLQALEMLPIAGHELWRVSLPPAKGWILTDALEAAGARCIADWAGGLIWAALPDAVADSRETVIQELSSTQGGYATLVRASAGKRRASHGAPSHGAPRGDAPGRDAGLHGLQSRIKRAFDPLGILNPGLQLGAGA
jgi:glycolate oxidase FAD binding subunit